MRRVTSIVAVNVEGVIGLGNALPWRVKSDMLFFKTQTSGNVVVMGRKTHDSLGQCLPNRHNVVISHQFSLFETTKNCVLSHSIYEALLAAEEAPSSYKEIFVIGGSSMYEQFSHIVDRYLITIVDKIVPDGDAYFDQSIISNGGNWNIEEIASGPASDQDEAAYRIFELTAPDAEDRMEARMAGIELIRQRRNQVGRQLKSNRVITQVSATQLSLA